MTYDKIRPLVMGQQRMIDAIGRLDPSQTIYNGWTISDVVAHLIGWDELVIRLIEEVTEKGRNEFVRIVTVDSYNLRSVEKRRDLSLKEVANQYVTVRQALLGLLVETPDDLLTTEIELPWGELGSIDSLLGIWIEHEREHLEEINEMMEKGKAK